ncbi:hypothetical protein C8R44DRAFT_882671 [Mycena epipterygia]|nr:hypothetical protein C8R44DRAFT_882671 [Mycena epipterygia]
MTDESTALIARQSNPPTGNPDLLLNSLSYMNVVTLSFQCKHTQDLNTGPPVRSVPSLLRLPFWSRFRRAPRLHLSVKYTIWPAVYILAFHRAPNRASISGCSRDLTVVSAASHIRAASSHCAPLTSHLHAPHPFYTSQPTTPTLSSSYSTQTPPWKASLGFRFTSSSVCPISHVLAPATFHIKDPRFKARTPS